MKTYTHNILVEVFFFLVVSFVICSIWYTSIKHTYQNGFDLEMKWTLKMVGISVYFVFIKNQENDLCGMIKTTAAAFISDKIIVFVYLDMMAFVWDKMSREKKSHAIRGCCWLHVYVVCNRRGGNALWSFLCCCDKIILPHVKCTYMDVISTPI